jgi:predicted RNA-binding protein with PUA-like domain
MKTEPDEFSFDDLAKRPKRTEPWTGVRNYQARNFLREMRKGDLAFFYHSSCEVPGIAGVAEITREAFPDPTAFDPRSDYYDADSRRDAPRWFAVDVTFGRPVKQFIPLEALRSHATKLSGFALLRRGNRLSVLPVDKKHWDYILKLGR